MKNPKNAENLGFGSINKDISSRVIKKNTNNGRLISWSPWPPASFKDRYPAFPFVLTLIILFTVQFYFSLMR